MSRSIVESTESQGKGLTMQREGLAGSDGENIYEAESSFFEHEEERRRKEINKESWLPGIQIVPVCALLFHRKTKLRTKQDLNVWQEWRRELS